jgi:hypothetical protein
MNIGTKTVLYGFHSFWCHPFFVARAWWTLYGFPLDPRLWLCFFVHDLGYWGKPNIDDHEGEGHPLLGATIMRVFGLTWHDFCLYHSRSYARRDGVAPSLLSQADKLSILLTPAWLMKLQMTASGELEEAIAQRIKPGGKFYIPGAAIVTFDAFHADMCREIRQWMETERRARE